MVVSFYKNSIDTTGIEVDHLKILGGIQSGRWQKEVENLRALLQELRPDDYSASKRQLPAATFGGTFSKREAASVIEPSGIIILDIDNLQDTQMDLYRSSFEEDQHIHSCFVSPSNAGFKLLVKYDADNHLQAFLSLEKYFKNNYAVTLDPSGKDISRLCYISFDPMLYLNEDSTVFVCDKTIVVNTANSFDNRPERFQGYVLSKDAKYAYQVCVKWTERHHQYEQGNRNNYIHVLACNMNRAGVVKDDALLMIYNAYSDLDFKEIEQTVNSAYKNGSEHNTIDIYNTDTENLPEHNEETETMTQQEETVYLDTLQFLVAKIKTNVISKYIKNFGVTFLKLDEENVKAIMNQAFSAFKKTKDESEFKPESVESVLMNVFDGYTDNGRVSTLIKEVDEAMGGGFMPGSVYGLIGDGKTCKSVYAQCVGSEAAKNDQLVLYLNGEMSFRQMLDRVVDKELNIQLLKGIKEKTITEADISSITNDLKKILKENFQIVSSSGWTQQSVIDIVSDIETKTNKKVNLIIFDGLSQMFDSKKDEIKSSIFNSGELKEIAKKTDSAVIVLVHVSGGIGKHVRDTSKFVRGGQKIICNFDAMLCTSLFIDESSSNLDEGDLLYRNGIFHMRFIDKRDSGIVISRAINVHRPMKLEVLDIDPQVMEISTK